MERRKASRRTYDSLASPMMTSMFLIEFLAKLSWAILAYSGENSRAVTFPEGPTASAPFFGGVSIKLIWGLRIGVPGKGDGKITYNPWSRSQ